MRVFLRRSISGLVLAVAIGFASAASADTTLTYVGASGQYQVYITPEAIRIDGENGDWQLYRHGDPAIVSVTPAEQTYTRLDRNTAGEIRRQMDALRARVENRVSQLPENRRPAARAAMTAEIPGLNGQSESVGLDRTGATDQVNGVTCDVIQIVRGGQPADRMCVASAEALGLSHASFDNVKSMFALLQNMLEGTGLEGIGLPYRDLCGMPVRFVDSVSGERRSIAAVDHEAIPDSRFDIPKNYVEQQAQQPGADGA